ncbi:MAG: tetratricopeptide (TPR) repeat protein [Crocinitomix sp.]|jgi:tetratricopeptide (TPR) repeat protein
MTKDANFAKGLIKVKENDHLAAIKLFTLVLKTDPKDANALSQRAVCYLNLQNHKKSMADINAAIQADPTHGYYYQCRAYIKANMKDYEGSIKDYEKAVELDPEDSIAYNNLALAQEQMGWAKQAKANFNKSDTIAGIKTAEERSKDRVGKNGIAEHKNGDTGNKNGAPVINKADKQKESSNTALQEAKSVFTKKSSFKEFLNFIKNGFKLKKDDKS